MKEAAYIEIVFEDHTYTATVYDMPQLRQFCNQCVLEGRKFRFGKIHKIGSIRESYLHRVMNQIRKFKTYDRLFDLHNNVTHTQGSEK